MAISSMDHLLNKRIPLTVGLTIVFTLCGFRLPYSGDVNYVIQLVEREGYLLMHSPLTILTHKFFYLLLQPFGFNAWQSVMVSSAFAGALAVQVLWAMRPSVLFLLINGLSGSFLVFMGQIENYAWLNLCLLGVFYWAEKFIGNQAKAGPMFLCFFLACAFHMMALFYIVPLFWLMKKKSGFHALEFIIPFCLFLLALGLNLVFHPVGLNINSTRLVPWFEVSHPGHHFTLFSGEHLRLLCEFHLQASFLAAPLTLFMKQIAFGLPLELPLLFWFRKRINSLFLQFIVLHCLVGLIWTTFWHPDLGKLDWDLFGQPYIAIHVLLGLLLCDWLKEKGKLF